MTDVYFHGNGDWFLKTDNGIRPVTSKIIPIFNWRPEKLRSEIDDISYTSTVFRYCPNFSAVFKLTPGDEEAYSISQSKKILKKRLVKLLPSLQPGSSFLDYVEKGLLSIDDIDNCYFLIQTSVKHSQEEPAKDVKFKLKILKTDSSVNTETKKHPEIKVNPDETQLKTSTEKETAIGTVPNKPATDKIRIFKGKPNGENELMLLAVNFITGLGLKKGDAQTVEPGVAWATVKSPSYTDSENLVIENREKKLVLNDGTIVDKTSFVRRYKDLFEWGYK